MLTLTHYRKFNSGRFTYLIWHWNRVGRSANLMYDRWYCAVVLTDNMRHRITRRKCHTAEDAMLYGARLTKRVNGYVDVTQEVMLDLKPA